MTELQEQNQNQHNFQEQEIHLADYLNIIIRRQKLFAAVFLTVFVSAFFYTFMMRPVYQTSSTINVKKDNANMGLNSLIMSGSDNSLQAELEIIKSRTIAEQVAEKMKGVKGSCGHQLN